MSKEICPYLLPLLCNVTLSNLHNKLHPHCIYVHSNLIHADNQAILPCKSEAQQTYISSQGKCLILCQGRYNNL